MRARYRPIAGRAACASRVGYGFFGNVVGGMVVFGAVVGVVVCGTVEATVVGAAVGVVEGSGTAVVPENDWDVVGDERFWER